MFIFFQDLVAIFCHSSSDILGYFLRVFSSFFKNLTSFAGFLSGFLVSTKRTQCLSHFLGKVSSYNIEISCLLIEKSWFDEIFVMILSNFRISFFLNLWSNDFTNFFNVYFFFRHYNLLIWYYVSYQNCSYLCTVLWEKIVLEIEKNFWNSRRICKIFEISRTTFSNSETFG